MCIRDSPTRPSFFYLSYQFPHPPLVPLKEYLDMYKDEDITLPPAGDWVDDSFIMKEMTESGRHYSDREIKLAKKAYFAQCTLIDHQIRLVLGCLLYTSVLCAKYRNGFEQAEYLKPDQIYPVTIRTTKISNTFLPGHSLRLTVTSSGKNFIFPNSNTEDGFDSTRMEKAHITVHRGAQTPSAAVMMREKD